MSKANMYAKMFVCLGFLKVKLITLNQHFKQATQIVQPMHERNVHWKGVALNSNNNIYVARFISKDFTKE